MIQKKKTILIYGLSGMQLLVLSSITAPVGITCRGILDTEVDLTIRQLLSGKKFPPKEARHLLGKFALLDGFDGDEQMATALINQAASGVIKAVHTKHNDSWRFSQLCGAISEEQRTMMGLDK